MEFKSGGSIVASSDPTDHALAAIASIRDNAEDEAALQPQSEAEKQAIAVIEDKPLAPEQLDPGSYFKVGPGPMASIRFNPNHSPAQHKAAMPKSVFVNPNKIKAHCLII